jgi:predicted transcriptional regulator
MIDEQLRILKFMNEMTKRTDTNAFAQKVGLTSAQLMHHMHELVKPGYLKKVGEGGFAITEKGKKILKAITPLQHDLKFHFYITVGQPTNLYAISVKEFRDHVIKVDEASVEFHVYRGDFENWFHTAVGDKAFAEELAKLKKKNLHGEELRKALAKAIEAEFSF